MTHRDLRHSYMLEEVIFSLFFLFGSSLPGCNQGPTSDFAKQQQIQQNAVDALTHLGAKIKKGDTERARGWMVDLSQVPFTSEIADQLKLAGSSIGVLDLSKTSIGDQQLADLIDHQSLNGVMELDLGHNAAITDQALDKLVGLLLLRDINLVGTQVTEAGIARCQEQRQSMTSKMENDSNLSRAKAIQKKFNIRH